MYWGIQYILVPYSTGTHVYKYQEIYTLVSQPLDAAFVKTALSKSLARSLHEKQDIRQKSFERKLTFTPLNIWFISFMRPSFRLICVLCQKILSNNYTTEDKNIQQAGQNYIQASFNTQHLGILENFSWLITNISDQQYVYTFDHETKSNISRDKESFV